MTESNYFVMYCTDKDKIEAWSTFERKIADDLDTDEDHCKVIDMVMLQGKVPLSVKLEGDVLIIKYKMKNNVIVDGIT